MALYPTAQLMGHSKHYGILSVRVPIYRVYYAFIFKVFPQIFGHVSSSQTKNLTTLRSLDLFPSSGGMGIRYKLLQWVSVDVDQNLD